MSTFNHPTRRLLLTEPRTREDRLKEALTRLLVFSNHFRRAHIKEGQIRDRITRLDGRIAAFSDQTYPEPYRPSPRDEGWVVC